MQSVLRQFSSRPRVVLWICLAAIAAVSFASLAAMPGEEGGWLRSGLRALCRPGGPDGHAAPLFAMWAAMVLAMMLPQAAPMLAVYLDIAEAARAKSIPVVSPLVLAGGYAAVWLAFAGVAALIQSLIGPVTDRSLAAALFIAAGLYQFTSFKHACLTKCRRPLPYFLSHWTEQWRGVFHMGVGQGINCLGCCWAMMLLAFLRGAMNPAWMPLIGGAMILKKVRREPKALMSGLGAGLAGAGMLMLVMS